MPSTKPVLGALEPLMTEGTDRSHKWPFRVRPILQGPTFSRLRATDSVSAIMRAKHCSLAQQSMLQPRCPKPASPSNKVIQAISELACPDLLTIPGLHGRWIIGRLTQMAVTPPSLASLRAGSAGH